MLIELAFAAALNVQSQDQPSVPVSPYVPPLHNASSYAVSQLPWAGGAAPRIDYPEAAYDSMVGGMAAVDCTVSRETGAVGNCNVVEETPAGYGFGRMVSAAVSRRSLDLTRWTGDTVRIRVEFRP